MGHNVDGKNNSVFNRMTTRLGKGRLEKYDTISTIEIIRKHMHTISIHHCCTLSG